MKTWSDHDDFIITLSVRSAFDLLLRALALPRGSEILMSALTVPDMERIARAHGLVVKPIDIDLQGNLCTESLRKAISTRARLLLIAHLFGRTTPLDAILPIAHEHHLLVIEDCAQSFRRVGERGHPRSDIAMWSFGPVKTATALGGAVVRVSDRSLLRRMEMLLSDDPIQPQRKYVRRLVRFSFLKLLAYRFSFSFFRRLVQLAGRNFDNVVNNSAKGFAADNLLDQIRQQPSSPLYRLLEWRWRTYDFTRIERRERFGRMLDAKLQGTQDKNHSYWIYPVATDDPRALTTRLQERGFDATQISRMKVIPADAEQDQPSCARRLIESFVFLPWYPDLSNAAIDEMGRCVLEQERRKGIATANE